MAANTHYTVALHSLLLLEGPDGGWTTSDWIASSVNTSPVFIRRILSQLRSAKLVEGSHGRTGGYRLTRAPEKITLWDVYSVFREDGPPFALHASHPNPKCPVGGRIQKHLKVVYAEAEDSMRKVLSKSSLASLRERLRTG